MTLSIDLNKQAKHLQDLKDHVDARTGENPAEFFAEIVGGVLLPRLKGDPVFVGNMEHKNRVTCLEILERTPRPEHARPYLPDIFQTLISLLDRDTEEVAIVALRILSDLHRGTGFDIEAPAFLDVIKRAHSKLSTTVNIIFSNKSASSAPQAGSVPGMPGATPSASSSSSSQSSSSASGETKKESPNEPKPRAEHSLKLFTETSNSIVFLFKNLPTLFNLTEWMQLMMGTLQVNPPENAISINRGLYSDLILAQTKTFALVCAFLMMVLPRKDEQQSQTKLAEVANSLQQLKHLPQCVVRLLKNCPPEAISTRKDIIVALRQMTMAQSSYLTLQTSVQPNSYSSPAITNPGWHELWTNFLEQLDEFLDEKTLVGTGRTAHETLRSSTWSVIAEYVNQSRNKLTLPQLTKLIGIYGRHIHDSSLPASSVSYSLRLISKLAEVVAMPEPNEAAARAQLLTKILDIFVNKLATMKRQIPPLLLAVAQAEKSKEKKEVESSASSSSAATTAATASSSSNTTNAISAATISSSMDVTQETKKDTSSSSSSSSSSSKDNSNSSTTTSSVDNKNEDEDDKILLENEAKWALQLDSVKESALAKDEPPTPLQQLIEMRSMVDTTINVIKTAVTQLQAHHTQHRLPKFALVEETYILNRLVRNAMRCLSVYDAPKLLEKSKNESGDGLDGSLSATTPPKDDTSSNAMNITSASSTTSSSSGKAGFASTSTSVKSLLQPSIVCAPGCSEMFEKDCTTISTFLINLDTNTLEDLLTHNLPYMYSCILEFPFLAVVLQALMNTNLVSPPNNAPPRPYIKTLNDIILVFLISKIPTMANADAVEAGILQRLFKAIFQTIGRQFDDPPMSPSWAPLLSGVVSQVLRLATETKDPLNLFNLLKYLFRNIPKHDIWSKELAHQLPTIIDTINRIQENTSSQQLKDLLIELPLTLPLRPSAMLPCFKLFLKPLMAALEAPESDPLSYTKTVHALRFLEGYIGQFSAEFFEPLIAEYKSRLLRALWRHMRQPPANFTSQVMRILGKMGGRIRPYAIPQLPITIDDASSLTIALAFDTPRQMENSAAEAKSSSDSSNEGGNNVSGPTIRPDPSIKREQRIIELPLLDSILSARRILFLVASGPTVSPQMAARRLSAFNFLKGCLFALLRPYADSTAPTKTIKSFTSEDLSSLEPVDAAHPLKLFTQPQYPAFVKIKDITSSITTTDDSGVAERIKTVHQLESERHSLKMILSSLITSVSTDSLKSVATELLEQLSTHFALLFVSHSVPNPSTLMELDPIVLIDAITDVLASENRDHAPAALAAIDLLLDACLKMDPEYVAPKEDKKSGLAGKGTSSSSSSSTSTSTPASASTASSSTGEKDELVEGAMTPFMLGLPVLTQLVQRLCDVCFKREWYYKVGGCLGIRHLMTRLPTSWIRHHQLAFLQAILFVLKDYPLGATVSVTEDATHTFLKVLRASNSMGGQMAAEHLLDDALLFLATHLTSTNGLVRKTIQSALDSLAEWSGSEVTELLEPHKKLILEPILQHPLSRVGTKLQQAHLDAVAYCLGLRPPLMPDLQELKVFLLEALTLAESEETLRNVPLATALVDALAAAVVGWKPFQSTENMELRTKTIAMFLRTLSSQTRQLVQCARRGLEQVVAADLMSRKTLQDVVSPTLSSLSIGKLTEHMLEGLGRYLALFPKFFTPELGKKLLDQLIPYTTIGEPGTDPHMHLPKLEPNETALRVTAAVMELCHLLPQANKLLDRVVEATLKLEARSASWGFTGDRRRIAPKELTSLYRAPLAKYLNRLPQESLAYFLTKLHDAEHTSLFVRCLKSEHAAALREELSRSGTKLIDAAFTPQASAHSAEEAFQMQYSGILLIKTLIKFYPDWLTQQKDILTRLHSLWNAPERLERLKNESQLSLRHSRETTYLIKCLLQYLRQNHHDTTLFLDLIFALTTPYCNGLFELHEFYHKYVPEHYSIQEKRTLLERVLADFMPESPVQQIQPVSSGSRSGYSMLHKQQILKSFVIRNFEVAVEKGHELLTKELIGLFLSNLFTLEQDQAGVRVGLAYELLSLLGFMLKNAPSELEEHLKDLIRFGWNFQRNEDPYTKQNANYLFSAIIKDRTAIAPPRIRITVYAALMRSYQTEVRTSVREALDMLVPVLLAPSATPDQQYIKWTRKVLYEESQVPQQLFHILYVLAKYEPCFRPWRSMFYTSLATSFPKLVPHSLSTPIEQRKLAIAIIDLLLTWERLRIKNEGPRSDTPIAIASTNAATTVTTTTTTTPIAATSPTPNSNVMDTTEGTTTQTSDEPKPAGSSSASSVSVSANNQDSPALDYGDGKLPVSQTEHILSTLMTASLVTDAARGTASTSSSSSASSSSTDLSFVFMKLVKEALEVWPTNMKLGFIFSRVLDKPENPAVPHARALLLLDTFFRAQPATILICSQELARSLPPIIAFESSETNRAFCQLLALLLGRYPIRASGSPLEQLYTSLMSELERVMQSEKPPVENVLAVLKTVLKRPNPALAVDEPKKESIITTTGPMTSAAPSALQPSTEATAAVVVKSENSMDIDSSAVAPSAHDSSNAMDVDSSTQAPTTTSSNANDTTTVSSVPPETKLPPPAPSEPDLLGPLLMPLMKMSLRLKDVVLAKPEPVDPNSPVAPKRPDSTPLLTIFKHLAPRLNAMSTEPRRVFLSLIYLLFDKSGDEQFLLSLIALAESLTLDGREANMLLQRMRRFDRSRTGPIGEAYFNLIYTFYNRYKSSDIAMLEPAFMSVLTARDASIRSRFISKFCARLPSGFVPRFEALMRPQTWEALPHLYWIQPSVEILLGQADAELPASLGSSAARVPQPRYTPQSGKISSRSQPSTAQSVLDSAKSFIDTLKQTTVGQILKPLSDLLYQDLELAGIVWSSVFQSVVKSDSNGALKRKVWQHIQTMLSQDSGSRGQRLTPPVAQFLLRSAHTVKLHLPPSLVKYVGNTYHAWHLAIHILEERIQAGFSGTSPDAPKGVVVSFPNHPPAVYQALGDLYSRLYEEDFTTALLINQSVMDDTRSGLILQQQGAFSRAQEVFYQALHDSSKGMIENVPEQEQSLWETQWIECAKRLNQWDVISSYSKSVGSIDLAAESAWKLGDWEALKDVLGKLPSNESPKTAALQAYSLLADKNAEVDSSHAMNLVLTQWVNLPRFPCPAYTPLLITLQRFIDIHDSIKIVKDTKADFISKIHDIKTIQLRLWRERLPHECDDMTHWHDVLQWRQHMFSMLTSALTAIPQAQSPALPMLGLGHHEAAWAINKMAHVARKQGLVDICFTSLPKIYELPNIEVQDAFTKLCEHIKCYFRLPLPLTRGILDIINTTNLNYFSAIQKAEFFHLKAEFYGRTGAFEEAAKAYSTAVLLYPSLPKVWTGWGRFYDDRFEALMGTSAIMNANQIEPMPTIFSTSTVPTSSNGVGADASSAQPSSSTTTSSNAPGTPALSASTSNAMDVDPSSIGGVGGTSTNAIGTSSLTIPSGTPKSRLTAAHYALSCYLLALKANPQISSRKMLVRVLWLLGYDDELCGDEAGVAAAIGAASSSVHFGGVPALSSSSSSLSIAPGNAMNVDAGVVGSSTTTSATANATATTAGADSSLASPDPSRDGTKKREATSPPIDDEQHSLKKRKLTESEHSETSHQLDEAAVSAVSAPSSSSTSGGSSATPVINTPVAPSNVSAAAIGASKMDVDASSSQQTPGGTTSEKPGSTPLSFSSMMVPPTPNTPATPSAYMIAATPATPSAPGTSHPTPGSSTLGSAISGTSGAASAPLPPDPLTVEVNRVRKMRLLCSTFCEHIEGLPTWIWLIWIPQLLSGLDRPEALAMQNVLKKICTHYPHAVFFPLRSWIAERKQMISAYTSNPITTVQNLTTERIGLRLAEDVMFFLRDKLPAVASDLERMSSEIEQLATLTLPEALLESFTTVLKSTYDVLGEDGINVPIEDRRAKLALQLQLIYSHLFLQTESPSTAPSTTPSTSQSSVNTNTATMTASSAPTTRSKGRAKKMEIDPPQVSAIPSSTSSASNQTYEDLSKFHPSSNEVIRAKLLPKFEEDFGLWLQHSDLSPRSSHGSQNASSASTSQNKRPSIRSTVVKMKSWLLELEGLVSSLPTWVELRKSSWLAQLQNDNTLEVPSIYLEDKEMSPDTCVFIDKFESPIKISKSNGIPRRIITIRGSNGQFYHWFAQSSSNLPISLAHIIPNAEIKSSSAHLSSSKYSSSLSSSTSATRVKNETYESSSGSGVTSSSKTTNGHGIGASSSGLSSSGASHSRMEVEDGGMNEMANGGSSSSVSSLKTPKTFSAVPVNMLWQREVRFSQLIRMTDRMMQKEIHVRKRAPALTVPNVVQLSPSLRIVSVEKDSVTLDDAMNEWHRKHGTSSVGVLSLFDGLLGGRRNGGYTKVSYGANGVSPHELSGEAEFAIASKERLAMYEAARLTCSDDAFMEMIHSHLSDHFEGVWHIRKTFMANIAQHLLLQYLFSATLSVTPERLSISPSSGMMNSFDFYPTMNVHGEMGQTPAVPFRLSPNLLRFFGPAIKGSLLDATLTASTIVIAKPNPQAMLSHHLHIYLRDDLLDIHRNNLLKAGFSPELNLPNPTNIVSAQLERNIKLIMSRIKKIAPPSLASYRNDTTTPINLQLNNLIEAAMDPLLASKMPVSWSAWI
jgi:phosphatidylinositol kinase/protein kinase (PI-3  family)